MELSLVIPVFNEEQNCRELYERILRAVEPLGLSFEIIFVDDGSRDATFDVVSAIAAEDARVKVVKLRRNYGQTPAMVAGLEAASGRILITMDGDLQNDPADIPAFLAKLAEGYDVVVGWRMNRQDKTLTRKVPSWVANRLIAWATGVRIRDNGCSLKAYRASIIREVPLYAEMHRFIPAMAWLAGARIAEIGVRHHPRTRGQSKYGLGRIYRVALDIVSIKVLLSASERPIRFFGGLGLITGGASVALGVSGASGGGAALAASGLAAMLALILVLYGVFGELLTRSGDLEMRRFARLSKRTA